MQLHLIVEGEDVLGVVQQLPPGGGDIKSVGQTVKELDVVVPLQLQNRLANGGLGDEKLPGR